MAMHPRLAQHERPQPVDPPDPDRVIVLGTPRGTLAERRQLRSRAYRACMSFNEWFRRTVGLDRELFSDGAGI